MPKQNTHDLTNGYPGSTAPTPADGEALNAPKTTSTPSTGPQARRPLILTVTHGPLTVDPVAQPFPSLRPGPHGAYSCCTLPAHRFHCHKPAPVLLKVPPPTSEGHISHGRQPNPSGRMHSTRKWSPLGAAPDDYASVQRRHAEWSQEKPPGKRPRRDTGV